MGQERGGEALKRRRKVGHPHTHARLPLCLTDKAGKRPGRRRHAPDSKFTHIPRCNDMRRVQRRGWRAVARCTAAGEGPQTAAAARARRVRRRYGRVTVHAGWLRTVHRTGRVWEWRGKAMCAKNRGGMAPNGPKTTANTATARRGCRRTKKLICGGCRGKKGLNQLGRINPNWILVKQRATDQCVCGVCMRRA